MKRRERERAGGGLLREAAAASKAKRLPEVESRKVLAELSALPKPPRGVDGAVLAALLLLGEEAEEAAWGAARKALWRKAALLARLRGYDQTCTEARERATRVKPLLERAPSPLELRRRSAAAAALLTWVHAAVDGRLKARPPATSASQPAAPRAASLRIQTSRKGREEEALASGYSSPDSVLDASIAAVEPTNLSEVMASVKMLLNKAARSTALAE